MYAVLVVWLRCLNLSRVTQLVLKRRLVGLTDTEAAELEDAGARDLEAARWYCWVYVTGLGLAAWFLVAFFVPWLVTLATWTAASSADGSPDSLSFWEALTLGCVAFVPVLLTISVVVKERRDAARHEALGTTTSSRSP